MLWCGFILYGSFIPFRFTTSPEVVRAKLAEVRLLPFEQGRKAFSTSDVVGNVLLFVPFGFLAAGAAPGVRGGLRRLSAIALPVGAGALLATGIEIGQLFAPGRTASGVDVLANMLGALVGSGLAVRASSVCTKESPSAAIKPITLPVRCQSRHIYNQYIIRLGSRDKRDALKKALGDAGVGTEIYYPVPMHLQQCFSSLGHHQGDFPNAEAGADQSLALPIFPELRKDEIESVVATVVGLVR